MTKDTIIGMIIVITFLLIEAFILWQYGIPLWIETKGLSK